MEKETRMLLAKKLSGNANADELEQLHQTLSADPMLRFTANALVLLCEEKDLRVTKPDVQPLIDAIEEVCNKHTP